MPDPLLPIAPTPIPALSPAPTLADPEHFDERADVHVAEVVQLVPRVNGALENVHHNARVAAQHSDAAFSAARDADAARAAAITATQTLADAAAASAAAAQAAAHFVGRWSELTGAIAQGSTVYHAGKLWLSLQAIPNAPAAEPGIAAAWAKAGGGIEQVPYDSRASLRSMTPATDELILVDGLGLFRYAPGSDEPDDDESCLATALGRWLLVCPHWDVVDTWQLPDQDELDNSILTGSAYCAVVSVGAAASATFSAVVVGAAPGDSVLATPPGELGATAQATAALSLYAYIDAVDRVVVRIANAGTTAANLNPAVLGAWPITVIKGD